MSKKASKLYRLPDVVEITGLKKSTIYVKIAEGDFPKPIKIGTRAVAWPDFIIQNWIDERIAESARA